MGRPLLIRARTLREHTLPMEGLLTHLAAADCFITLPHPALDCGIFTAWWQSQVARTNPVDPQPGS